MQHYTIPQDVLQAAVGLLNEMPAHKSRYVLNAIEEVCTKQDRERAEQQDQEKVASAISEARKQWETEPKQVEAAQ